MNTMSTISGLHHVTCVVSNADRALDFYVGVLGLVPILRTVDFNDTSVLQLYCADTFATPGTIISLLEHRDAKPAFHRSGQVSNIVFSIGEGTEAIWEERLARHGMKLDGYAWSFGRRLLCLSDPDGLALGLMPSPLGPTDPYSTPSLQSPVVGRILSMELQIRNTAPISHLLSSVLGFHEAEQEGPVTRFELTSSKAFAVDVLWTPTYRADHNHAGVVDRVTWSVSDAATLNELGTGVGLAGYEVSSVLDKHNFQTVYFEGPENLKLAIATVDPGFVVFGKSVAPDRIVLPPWLESQRDTIEHDLANDRRRG